MSVRQLVLCSESSGESVADREIRMQSLPACRLTDLSSPLHSVINHPLLDRNIETHEECVFVRWKERDFWANGHGYLVVRLRSLLFAQEKHGHSEGFCSANWSVTKEDELVGCPLIREIRCHSE